MARKKLLTEGEIRRFMKLASMQPVGAYKMQEMSYGGGPGIAGQRDEEEMDLEAGVEDEGGEEVDMEIDVEEEPVEGEEEMDVGAGEGGDMVSIDDFVAALETAVEEVTGQPTSAELEPGEEEEGFEEEGEEEMDLGGEEGLPPEEEGDEELSMAESRAWRRRRLKETTKGQTTKGGTEAFGSPTEEEETEEGGRAYTGETEEEREKEKKLDEIVNLVSRRVARRLSKRAKNDQIAEQLANRIMRRLTK